MITTDFSNYILTKSERKLLKKIKRGKVAVYCDYHIPQGNKIMITELGKAFLKWKKRDNIRFWFPVVISIIALAISVLALA